ncbi:MAG: FliI/YscN family ATPase [Treponema sp.]|nr:FliI/YscN family ATPase [Spirochaetia bacterium]MDD7581184.1 FliI/YscN family ATPase [Treponema sp.]MDY4129973.1 FliI/YscN family ATPase [Treponema sp.]MDY5838347.1 FliI/YscN family ATPase [Treponema sp.]MEE0892396.1 FliI/YscN family ATPase [Treponema sp.]
MESFFDKYINTIERTEPIKYTGSVIAVKGLMIECNGPRSVIGEICTIHVDSLKTNVLAEVVGLEDNIIRLMAFGETRGIEIGSVVVASGHVLEVPVGKQLLGRVIDATGKPYDGKGEILPETYYPALNNPPNPMSRKSIDRRVVTGVRAIDSLLTVGKGQRLGIFAGSGVGKSTLLSTIARNTSADINVIALIGERGREVKDFIENDLGEEGLKRSVLVVATSDTPSIARLRAAYVATAIAEYFRDQGKDVMMLFDSVTRFAHAQREIGLATGEPPAQRGYPPSVFDMLPKLLERTGTNDKGSITAFYTVLVDGGDMDEPIADKVRGTLDGHIVLSRELAGKQHYPAIDMLTSISRLAKRVSGTNTNKAVQRLKKWIALYSEQEDFIKLGVYQRGNSTEIDEAIEHHEELEDFLCQDTHEHLTIEDTLQRLSQVSGIEIPEEEYAELQA